MHQTKSDNLDEIVASYMEHSHADDLEGSHDDSSDTSSDLDSSVKVTQVKVGEKQTKRSLSTFVQSEMKGCPLLPTGRK